MFENQIIKQIVMKRNLVIVLALSIVVSGCKLFKKAEQEVAAVETVEKKAEPTLVERKDKDAGEIAIPYAKYVLDNGLVLLIHEDHSDPIVHVDVTYHVGSAREEIGRSGFAHFFEHMMFQGSDHVADEEHFKIVTEAGGRMNGTTNSDRTNYFETLPKNQLETALWLEADRMGFLLDAVTQEKFEVQRATVKNERGQRIDNRPYGLVGEKTGQALYPYAHPYSWPVIGYMKDLDAASLQDLKNFFLRWYGPNNATLTVAGDISEAEVLEMAQQYFGSIPKGPAVENMEAPKVSIASDRYVSYEDNVRFPLLQMIYPAVPARHSDEAPLDVLADILGGGKNSIFYKNFDKTGLAVQSSVYNPSSELGGMFTFSVVAFPGKSLEEMETMVRKSILEFEFRGVTDDDLTRFKASYEASEIQGLASVSGKASKLAYYQTFTGNPGYIKEDLARYANVTKEDVMRVYNTYIKDKHGVILSVVPKEQSNFVAGTDNYEIPTSGYVEKNTLQYDTLVYNKANDNFDRSMRPSAGANPVVEVPEYWKTTFANGLKVIGTVNDELPTTTIQLSVPAGHRYETTDKAGIATLMAGMLEEKTQNYTAEEIQEKLEKLGANIWINSGSDNVSITISTLTKNLDEVIPLAEQMIFKPAFAQEDFDRLKSQQLEAIANQATSADVIANNNFNQLLYGKNSIKGVPSMGTEASVASISLKDVQGYYNTHFGQDGAKLVVVADLSQDEVLPKLLPFINWEGNTTAKPALPEAPEFGETKIYLIDKENAPQSEVRIGYLTNMVYNPLGEHFKATAMNYTLGGAFNSRINLNLREDKGYTYGARSRFSGGKEPGAFSAGAAVRGDATAASIKEFMSEISKYRSKGITTSELSFTKSSIGQADALKYETARQKAGFLRRLLDYDLDASYVKEQTSMLNAMTVSEVNQLAKKHLPEDKMEILVVGDKEAHLGELKKLGYDIVVMSKEGEVLEEIPYVNKKRNMTKAPSVEKVTVSYNNKGIPVYTGSFKEAYKKASKDLGQSEEKVFIWKGEKYTTEFKFVPLEEK